MTDKRRTQQDRLLALLEITTYWPEDSIHGWIHLPTILALSPRIASHTKIVSKLRAKGHDIRCEEETVKVYGPTGEPYYEVHTRYRLLKKAEDLNVRNAEKQSETAEATTANSDF